MRVRDPRGVEEKTWGGLRTTFSFSDDLSGCWEEEHGDSFGIEGCVPRGVHSQTGGQATPNGLGAVGAAGPDVLRS